MIIILRTGIIYICINLYNGKRYIGQTIQKFENRKKNHIQDALNKNSQLYFHKALRKFGVENFIWNVLENNIAIENLNDKEQFYIQKYNTNDRNNGYNLTNGGDCSHTSILNNQQVNDIKNLLKTTNISFEEISNKYSIGVASISDINNGDTWFDTNEYYPLRLSIYNKKLNKDDVMKIYDMLRDGVQFKDIAKLYNCSNTNISNINYGKVHRYLDDNSYPICKKKFSHLSQEEVDMVVKLLLTTNLSQQKIADYIGIRREVVKNINIGNHKKVKGIDSFPIRKQK